MYAALWSARIGDIKRADDGGNRLYRNNPRDATNATNATIIHGLSDAIFERIDPES